MEFFLTNKHSNANNPKIYQFNIYMLRDDSKEILKLFVFIIKALF